MSAASAGRLMSKFITEACTIGFVLLHFANEVPWLSQSTSAFVKGIHACPIPLYDCKPLRCGTTSREARAPDSHPGSLTHSRNAEAE